MTSEPTPRDRRVLLVCSTGGHLAQLLCLRPWWAALDRAWVTFDRADARSHLASERTWWAHHPTTRNLPNALRNLVLARRVLRDERPDVIVSNGAGVAVPFFLLARRMGIPTVYVEVFDRVDSPTLTGRMCRPLTDLFCVQWAEQQAFYPRSVVIGPLL
ncbi:PssD/Cps14F family polysaccharide biosynthesis glycosyltransferase [Iamia sp.]|uniref:PssD/Cps14F family polysaccharide biosynthesis glycosyltransferase n=1 Tax=Iamia sp. TaxID=2722710 RepID=UPI002CB1DCB3|nr:PssD/Cps14F family polysaccharide biosynthesis glycosyltransferase [Iamia sp.]HXH58063.1 PssD/Cps14F family polysaccharide biosynthesis glycosyltransferase [Iamia sp.]